MRITRLLTAAIAVAGTLAVCIGASTSAVAATDEFRPGVFGPVGSWKESWRPDLETRSMIAQPFTQPETGQVHTFTFEINDLESSSHFTSAALHSFDNASGPSADPIEGGIAQISLGDPVNGKIDALLTFPHRPTLVEGERYAVVINPLANIAANTSASFSYYMLGVPSDFYSWELLGDKWQGHGTLSLVFSSQLVTSVATPEAPTLGTAECGIVPDVVLPVTEGVTYDAQQEGMSWVITAEAAEGYELAAESTTSWTLEFTVAACTIVPANPADPVDPVDPDETEDPVDEEKPVITNKPMTEDKLVVQQKPANPKGTLADTGVNVTGPLVMSLSLLLLGGGAFVATRLARVN